MKRRHRMAIGPWQRRSDRELVGTLLALVETGQVVTHSPITSVTLDGSTMGLTSQREWAVRRAGETTVVRQLPGDHEARGDSDFVPGKGVRGGRPTRMCNDLFDLGWVVLGEPNEAGVCPVSLSEDGENWLAFCRGNTWDIDIARIPGAWAEIELERAAFRVYCDDRGIDHGHQDVER